MTELSPGKDTPMLRQYRAVKNQAPGAILLFRLGDFYEMFGEDARRAAPVLEIALTARNTMPMCGIPYHAATGYIAKLVKAGFKVAVCDQVEDPRQARGIVRREITRIITPGTMVEEELLDQARANYLASVCRLGSVFGLASLEISTGEFRTTEIGTVEQLLDELIGLRPGELLLPPSLEEEVGKPLQAQLGSGPLLTTVEEWKFDYEMAYETLNRQFGTASLDGFGCAAMIPGIAAAGAVMEYARENLRRPVGHIHHLIAYET
ncbi:MAG TPA: hypothetical protein PK636_00195 [bacterium]|nr:hypothetical protein [bacterium]